MLESVPISDHDRVRSYLQRADTFIDDYLAFDRLRVAGDYVPGSRKLDFHEDRLNPTLDPLRFSALPNDRAYEAAIAARLRQNTDANVVIALGAMGSGKSTLVRYLHESLSPSEGRASTCWCGGCPRRPLVVELLAKAGDGVTPADVLRRVQRSILTQMVDCWLRAAGRTAESGDAPIPPETRVILQQCILFGIVRLWSLAFGPGDHRWPDVRLPERWPRFAELVNSPSADSLRTLESEGRLALGTLIEMGSVLSADDAGVEGICAALLGCYAARATAHRVIVIVDNIDALPTRRIVECTDALHRVGTEVPGTTFFVPVRPSSIRVYGNVQNVTHVHHWGPSWTEVVHRRLLHYVLSRPASALSGVDPDGLPSIWGLVVRPGEAALSPQQIVPQDEVRTLVAACSVLYTIVARDAEDEHCTFVDAVHADHRAVVAAVDVPPWARGALRTLLDGLIGLNVRIGLTHLSRILLDLYREPGPLLEIVRSSQGGGVARLHYRRLVESVVVEAPEIPPRWLNLFRPREHPVHLGYPSTVMVRVLSCVARERRIRARTVVELLQAYGVPAELAVYALNQLHDRFRLVWFSDGHQVECDEQSLNQDVVISEVGVAYSESVIFDFEFLWACALRNENQQIRASNFPARLEAFARLLSKLVETESKQIAFRRLSTDGATSQVEDDFVGSLLLQGALLRACRTAVGVLQRREGEIGDDYRQHALEAVAALVDGLLFAHQRYSFLFGEWPCGSEGDEQRRALVNLLSRLTVAGERRGALAKREQVNRLLFALSPGTRGAASSVVTTPTTDPVEWVAARMKGLAPKNLISTLDAAEYADALFEAYTAQKHALSDLVSSLLLAAPAHVAMVRALQASAHRVREACVAGGAASQPDRLRFLEDDAAKLAQLLDAIERTSYAVPDEIVSPTAMSRLKHRFNDRLDVLDQVVDWLGASGTRRLRHSTLKWR